MSTVPLDEESIRAYLDSRIVHWRKRHRAREEMAIYYVDAFQSVRASLFGEVLPPDADMSVESLSLMNIAYILRTADRLSGGESIRVSDELALRMAVYLETIATLDNVLMQKVAETHAIAKGGAGTMSEMTLAGIIELLRSAARYGAERDEPEGVRWIQISDTLALRMVDYLEQFQAQDELYRRLTAMPGSWSLEVLEAAEAEAKRLREQRMR